ncbi:MAG: hypothetical protein PHE50_01880 [Dehalococcoidales bacterium]|nr:hypothetical protein [Dehalococcoidales bacterium]
MDKHSYLMVVDDNNAVISLLNRFMELESRTGVNNRQAGDMLALLTKSAPNLVLLDIALPTGKPDKSGQDMMQPVIKISVKCEVATLGNALDAISANTVNNKSAEYLDAMSMFLSNVKVDAPKMFESN